MKQIFFYLAAIGWILSVTIHILSIADIDVNDKIPLVWSLHLGIFIVWLPAILFLRRNKELIEFQKNNKSRGIKSFSALKIIFKDTPKMISLVAILGFFYAGVNFLLLITETNGTAAIKDGQYILHSHGNLIRILTEKEYHHYKAIQIRSFSGHWIAFYGVATAILYNTLNRTNKHANIGNEASH